LLEERSTFYSPRCREAAHWGQRVSLSSFYSSDAMREGREREQRQEASVGYSYRQAVR